MSHDPPLAELLLRWQEAQDAGNPVSDEELCNGSESVAAALRKQIDAMNAMRWLDRVQGATQQSNAPTGKEYRSKVWQTGQEPVPGYQLVKPL